MDNSQSIVNCPSSIYRERGERTTLNMCVTLALINSLVRAIHRFKKLFKILFISTAWTQRASEWTDGTQLLSSEFDIRCNPLSRE